ncbi:carotenoid 9,10(9',10')-cleavage dioxygenase isoform X1 [Capsicum annuum]|uniref:carotenoid 9,10(9',10')-cleavage dioxygenase isoform X1 n=1 Tax=Capsicum annuum TaxID=4072 RepID=UPI0007BF5598|nr:carotenoid 9,10(9',10')-cleavage dioxygenase isoform X1 [Capsicum annuum]XP_047255572.1 carotenoid 9,10(9',10')-cleavage dioxygenase isoform X1 [Capsicum annuum]XP_047255573.1 carotenoid 9,10(9',10')-cleavage dioxygenase isoform X1 [Capsicum annuum]XP_047255574.1 carotenoid 9,10(9',10')-cleavage dioxygenase isoform X1 [Capsicum annuum]XP_047255575.1 carotenoid 9,10(9',10')-cleavage dioxygenase isoform X1 [Capsicum annuum]
MMMNVIELEIMTSTEIMTKIERVGIDTGLAQRVDLNVDQCLDRIFNPRGAAVDGDAAVHADQNNTERKRLQHSFTAHPKVDPITGEIFTFGYSQTPPYATYRIISKDGVMQDPVPITIPASVLVHDFTITENYAIMMDLPLYFRPKEMVKNKQLTYSFDSTRKVCFGVLQRYAKNESLIKWFELPNGFIFHNEGDDVVLITCHLQNPDLDVINGTEKEQQRDGFTNELYEMRFNMKNGLAS